MRSLKERPYALKSSMPSMTKQSFKDECDINNIMAKFQKTGALTHYMRHAPEYGDATQVEYADALNVVANANTMFEELPSSIRKKFDNDPAKFLEFVQDEKNESEMEELGLKKASSVSSMDPDIATEEHPSGSTENTEEEDGGQES